MPTAAAREAAPADHDQLGSRRLFWWLAALMVAAGIAARLNGLLVSFWMDEAWVANSLLGGTWRDVFYYPAWLQTSPPGFLALASLTVEWLGESHVTFRLIPLLSGIIGLGVVAFLSRRLAPVFGILALIIAAFSPTALDYSRMLKQYSTELAAAALMILTAWRYAERPTGRRFAMAAVSVALGLTCAYGSIFVVCGVLALTSPIAIALAGKRVTRTDVVRWIALGTLAASVLAIEFLWFYRPNYSPELRRFWDVVSLNRRDSDIIQTLFRHCIILTRHLPVPAGVLSVSALAGLVTVVTGMALGMARSARRRLALIVLCLCGVPALAIIVSGLLDLYPNYERTSLFLVPGLSLLIAYAAQVCFEEARDWARAQPMRRVLPWTVGALWTAAALTMAINGASLGFSHIEPREDYRAAVDYIRANATGDDLVYVHACCVEGFRLYQHLAKWNTGPSVAVGETGQPCCPRHKDIVKVAEPAVEADILTHVPTSFRGRVWLLYVDRLDYWRYSSVAPEGPILRKALQSAGCGAAREQSFTNMKLDVIDCSGRPPVLQSARAETP